MLKIVRFLFIMLLLSAITFPVSAYASGNEKGSSQKNSLLSQITSIFNLSKLWSASTYQDNSNNASNNKNNSKDNDHNNNSKNNNNNDKNNNKWDDYDWYDISWNDKYWNERADSYDIWKKWFCY
ncbi:hypothetical protein [Paenibacillus planticolens]|uniref:Uncharacterized protein n=1 Tax=Paenibacillus planticolens TaxID=2654976 RepID=A0ABX1ZJC9_9BACL|nr:hypothetical protein [Paenibacillus planticolens]NOV00192.1 hypothetical protein [Paenibacillus planticolens]